MDAGKSTSSSALLDDLIALCDEMAALARAGVPLESGLADVAEELRGPSRKLAADLARKMQAGENLPQALADSPETFPPLFRSVVTAGIRSGRLPAALEGLADNGRKIADLRRMTRAAAIYPIFIALLAFGLFVYSIIAIQPQIAQTYESMRQSENSLNSQLIALGMSATNWVPVVLLVALTLAGLWWFRSSQATLGSPGPLSFMPTRRLHQLGQQAAFADIMALLVDNQVPLDEAVTLAADASGSESLRQSARRFADDHARGALSAEKAISSVGLPPLVSWMLVAGNPTALAESLRSTAESYHRRALQLDDRLRLYLPLVLTVAIGGGAVVLYALSVLVPWFQMLVKISGTHQ